VKSSSAVDHHQPFQVLSLDLNSSYGVWLLNRERERERERERSFRDSDSKERERERERVER